MVLDRSPFPTNSSIRDFQNEKAGYVAHAIKKALLLPEDMVDLRTLKKHKVFPSLKKDLAMVSLSSYVFFFFFYSLPSFLCKLFQPLLEPRNWWISPTDK